MSGPPRVRALLLWPAIDRGSSGNFGVPQLLSIASYAQARAAAEVDVVDLSCERALGSVDLARIFAGPDGQGYDVIGLSVYSSYDYLVCMVLAEQARQVCPEAVLVAGGYHVSARPADIVFDGSPFDVAVVGEGERPFAEVVRSVAGGSPLRQVVLGPDPIEDLDTLPVTDWSLLRKYRDVARTVASQAEVYLSRGCPFDCAFCMERAKRETSWRPYSVDRAIEEFVALHRFLDLTTWTVYVADALFGMRKAWRREFLEKLTARGIPTEKIWLLVRVDMIERVDLELFHRANVGLGFGLESGDPDLLAIIRKAGRLHDYLDRMKDIAVQAREIGLPWGANVIVGHPGETEATLKKSAAYMRELFLDPRGTTGFLSVDPFRLYPGSPIDDERDVYAARFGTRFHRTEWWKDGDQEFLSEWVDPSASLDFRRRGDLMASELGPILREAPAHFRYEGNAAPYFRRAVESQIRNFEPRGRLQELDRYYAWRGYLGEGDAARRERAGDEALAAITAAARAELRVPEAYRAAFTGVRRELFVPTDATAESLQDAAIALDTSGMATVSAFHAYARTFALAGIGPGMRVLDLGAGTGYGTALLAAIVGPSGAVRGVELDPSLVELGAPLLPPHASLLVGDADDAASWEGTFDAVVVGFAVAGDKPEWIARLAGFGDAVLVMPRTEPSGKTHLVRIRPGRPVEVLEEVSYVRERHGGVGLLARPPASMEKSPPVAPPRRALPIMP